MSPVVAADDDLPDWRPMRAAIARRPMPIVDPLVEPLWSGTRVIAHVRAARDSAAGRGAGASAGKGESRGAGGRVALVDDLGDDLATSLAALAAELAAAVFADEAILDAVVTHEALLSGEGTAPVTEAWLPSRRFLTRGDAGVDVRRRDAAPRGSAPRDDGPSRAGAPGQAHGESGESVEAEAEAEGPGIVCLDLLRLDGQELLDLPLLERKRLLESVVRAEGLVRVSVHVRPPVDAWLASWKSLGLRGAMLKAANSRYRPGARTLEWRTVERLSSGG